MIDDLNLRQRLTDLIAKTASGEGLPAGAYYRGDVAGKRQVEDDFAAGRDQMWTAHENAKDALRALDQGALTTALAFAWAATDFYIASLEAVAARIRPSEKPTLRPAGRRGRPRKKV